MDFHADHDLPIAGLAFDEFRCGRVHAALHQLAGLFRNWAASSSARPVRSTVPSSNALPISCSPSGKPLSARPAGTESPGRPARLTVTVKTSFRYMETGSSVFSPTPNAGLGVAGVSNTSQFSNALSKSRLIKVRNF